MTRTIYGEYTAGRVVQATDARGAIVLAGKQLAALPVPTLHQLWQAHRRRLATPTRSATIRVSWHRRGAHLRAHKRPPLGRRAWLWLTFLATTPVIAALYLVVALAVAVLAEPVRATVAAIVLGVLSLVYALVQLVIGLIS